MDFSFVASIVSGISAVATRIGTAISKTVSTIAPVMERVLSQGGAIFNKVIGVAQSFSQIMGVLKPDEKIDDVGDRAIQASEKGLVPEQFKSYEEYLKEIRSFDLDPEKSKEISSESKVIIGMTVAGKALEEKLNLAQDSAENLVKVLSTSPDHFNVERLQRMISLNVDFGEVVGYFDEKLPPSRAREIKSQLFNVEKAIDPGISEDAFYDKLSTLKNKPM